MPQSLIAAIVLALAPLVTIELVAGKAVAAVASGLAGLLVVTLLVALVRDRRHDADDEHSRTGTFGKAAAP